MESIMINPVYNSMCIVGVEDRCEFFLERYIFNRNQEMDYEEYTCSKQCNRKESQIKGGERMHPLQLLIRFLYLSFATITAYIVQSCPRLWFLK